MNSCNAQLSIFSKPQYRSERSYRLRRPFCYEVGSGAVRWQTRESPTPFYNRAILVFPQISAVSWLLRRCLLSGYLGEYVGSE